MHGLVVLEFNSAKEIRVNALLILTITVTEEVSLRMSNLQVDLT